ncbi:MAG: hypothetical protein ACLP5H_16395 [Desulfomonilaceae bacterium]
MVWAWAITPEEARTIAYGDPDKIIEILSLPSWNHHSQVAHVRHSEHEILPAD